MEFETLVQPHLLLPPFRIRSRSPQRPPRLPPVAVLLLDRFTSTELDAAEQLVQLSGSSGGGGSSAAAAVEEEKGVLRPSSANSSPRSVNTRPPPPQSPEAVLLEAEDEDCDDDAMGPRRRVMRYRAIADVYAATEPIVAAMKLQKRKREGER